MNHEKIGKYEICEQIGSGAMGIVYKGYDPDADRFVALKIMSEDALDLGSEATARFTREARLAAKLHHHNIATIFEVELGSSPAYIAMEYIPGPNLRQFINDNEQLDKNLTVEIARQICCGMHFAHEKNIIHRDLKPANIVLHNGTTVKILDFGIAREITGRNSGVTITLSGSRIGTPEYMSPEQVRCESPARKSDIWAFGILLYELETGKKVFTTTTPEIIFDKILKLDPERLYFGRDSLLENIIRKCLSSNPASRYENFQAIEKDLTDISKDIHPVNRGKKPSLDDHSPVSQRGANKINKIPFFAAIVLLAGIIGYTFFLFLDEKPAFRFKEHPAIISELLQLQTKNELRNRLIEHRENGNMALGTAEDFTTLVGHYVTSLDTDQKPEIYFYSGQKYYDLRSGVVTDSPEKLTDTPTRLWIEVIH